MEVFERLSINKCADYQCITGWAYSLYKGSELIKLFLNPYEKDVEQCDDLRKARMVSVDHVSRDHLDNNCF